MKRTGFIRDFGYAFTLMALLSSSCGSKGIDEIKVPGPKADFSFSVDIADKLTINFTNGSENVALYTWDFGDNTATSVDKNPRHTYAKEGTYNVTLIVKNSAGATDTKKTIITVEPNILPEGTVSGLAVPIGDIGEWKQVFYDDFTKNAPVGSWGSDCDPNKIVYTGAQGQQWKAYPKCYVDTYQKRPYRSDKVLSVKGGALYFHLHTVDGQPAGANPSPVIYNGSQYQTYGRYTARFKVDTGNLSEYYAAWLLWPQTEKWPDDGEEDFPEGSLNGYIGGFHHYAGTGACIGCQDGVATTEKFTDWHTYTIEWRPGNVKYFLDGKVILNSNKWVPEKPMRWQLQTETKGNGTNSGNLVVDWVAVYKYEP